jgi:hypothetical protein
MTHLHPTEPIPTPIANGGCGATLAAWRRLEHRQLGAGYRTFPDRALEPWNGEVRPFGRVGVWRGGGRPNISVAAPFVWRCLTGSTLAPFPHSAHRTGRADLSGSAAIAGFCPHGTRRAALPQRALQGGPEASPNARRVAQPSLAFAPEPSGASAMAQVSPKGRSDGTPHAA